jgi:trans-aconitate methyltransferase
MYRVMSMSNDYNVLGNTYSRSSFKADKRYSILPTVLKLIGDISQTSKVILDLGCGDGFFTAPIAERFPLARVIGIDNSKVQLEKAKVHCVTYANIELQDRDVFNEELPNANIIIAPFILNYISKSTKVESFFKKMYAHLSSEGVLIGVIDDPHNFDNKKYGAIKRLKQRGDGQAIFIDLYDINQEFICTLTSHFFKQATITSLLKEAGFEVSWHEPIVSEEGVRVLGKEFWEGYSTHSELLYFLAKKK